MQITSMHVQASYSSKMMINYSQILNSTRDLFFKYYNHINYLFLAHHMHLHMQYQGLSPSDDIVIWFWKLVYSLKEEEKALLLKFATGSPRAPAGGFSTLQVH